MTGQEDAERSISDSGFVLAPPDRLYLPSALYDSWDPDDEQSLGRSLDYRTYLATLAQGQPIARSRGIGNGRALHDAAISYSLAQRVADVRSVGILVPGSSRKCKRASIRRTGASWCRITKP